MVYLYILIYIEVEIKFLNIYRGIVAAVARKAHNLEVGGSIPSPATKFNIMVSDTDSSLGVMGVKAD